MKIKKKDKKAKKNKPVSLTPKRIAARIILSQLEVVNTCIKEMDGAAMAQEVNVERAFSRSKPDKVRAMAEKLFEPFVKRLKNVAKV